MEGTGQAIAFVLVGFISGVCSGALGIGGAAIGTPLVRMLGVSPYLAIGTPVPMILTSTITGSYAYLRAGLVNRRALVWTAPSAALATFAGASTTRQVNGSLLMLVSAALLFFLAIRLLGQGEQLADATGPQGRGPAAYLGLGIANGFASGLLGVGGGFVMVPVFLKFFGMGIKQAVGTSLAVIAVTVPPNIAGHARAGNIDWLPALILSVSVIPGARIGARLAISASERALRTVMAITLAVVAVAYAGQELAGMFSG
ncbi:MAG: sulfite exporter TauE/SafE family protein [Actinomycetota bacterium]